MKKFFLSVSKIITTFCVVFILGAGITMVSEFIGAEFPPENLVVSFILFLLLGISALVVSDYMFSFIERHSPKWLRIVLLIILWALVLVYVVYAIALLSLSVPEGRPIDASIKSNLSGARAQAELYWESRGESYTGVCDPVNSASTNNTELADGIYDLIEASARQRDKGASINVNQIPFASADTLHAKCNDSGGAYAAEVALKSAGFWCVDSTGVSQKNESPGLTATDDYNCNP
ncbi:MAG: hypothetical protein AAB343_04000 [Patescibacteria group bacterium]